MGANKTPIVPVDAPQLQAPKTDADSYGIVPTEESLAAAGQLMKNNTDPAFDGPWGAKGWYLYPYWHFCFRQPDTPNRSLCATYLATYGRMWFYGGFMSIAALVATQMLYLYWNATTCEYSFAAGKSTNQGLSQCNIPDGKWFDVPGGRTFNNEMFRMFLASSPLANLVFGILPFLPLGFRRVPIRYWLGTLAITILQMVHLMLVIVVWKTPSNSFVIWTVRLWHFVIIAWAAWHVSLLLQDRAAGLRLFVAYAIHQFFLNGYAIIISMLVVYGSSSATLLVLRAIVHPVYFNAYISILRRSALDFGWAPGTLAIAVYVSPLMLSAWFGRFLILQLSSVGNVVVINLLQLMFTLVSRISFKPGAGFVNKLLYGRKGVDALVATKGWDLMRFSETQWLLWFDVAMTILFACLASYPRVTGVPGMLPDLQSQWSQAFGQIFTSLLGEVLGGMLEVILFDIDIKWYWYHTKSYLFRGMLVFSVLFFVTNWSLIMFITIIFCPNTYDDGRGVLWEMCKKPQYVDTINRATFGEFL